jgi:hypothetical protein
MGPRASEALTTAYEEAKREVTYARVKRTDATNWLRRGRLMSLWPLEPAPFSGTPNALGLGLLRLFTVMGPLGFSPTKTPFEGPLRRPKQSTDRFLATERAARQTPVTEWCKDCGGRLRPVGCGDATGGGTGCAPALAAGLSVLGAWGPPTAA